MLFLRSPDSACRPSGSAVRSCPERSQPLAEPVLEYLASDGLAGEYSLNRYVTERVEGQNQDHPEGVAIGAALVGPEDGLLLLVGLKPL